MLKTDAVVRRMKELWQTKLSLPTTPELEDAWRKMACTLNSITAEKVEKNWQILPLPTGTGKTTMLAVYCSMLNLTNHPGVLIVCRTKQQANEVASLINDLADGQVAIPSHSDTEEQQTERSVAPILVVTHQAYRLAVQSKDDSMQHFTRWERLTCFRGGVRRLTVIDESLDIFEEVRFDCRDFELLIAMLKRALIGNVSKPLKILGNISRSLSEHGYVPAIDLQGNPTRHDSSELCQYCFQPLRTAINQTPSQRFQQPGRSARNELSEKRVCLKLLSDIEKLVCADSKLSGNEKYRKLTTTKVLMGHADQNIVILDATSDLNPVYKLIGDQVNIVEIPPGIRNYRNATLHCSKGHIVGKGYMSENGEQVLENLIPVLERQLNENRKVLLITSKAIADVARSFKNRWAKFTVANWGALDGRNDWADYDAIVLCGLPYLDSAIVESRIEILGGSPCREAKRSYQLEWLSASVVQAVNRIRCRRVTAADGGCDAVDIFALLPTGGDADLIEANIAGSMLGIKISEWQFSAGKKKAKRSKIADALIDLLNASDTGHYSIESIRERIGAKERAFRNVLKKINDTSSDLYARLKELNVSYERGSGRGNESYFLIHENKEKHAV